MQDIFVHAHFPIAHTHWLQSTGLVLPSMHWELSTSEIIKVVVEFAVDPVSRSVEFPTCCTFWAAAAASPLTEWYLIMAPFRLELPFSVGGSGRSGSLHARFEQKYFPSLQTHVLQTTFITSPSEQSELKIH